MNEYLASYYADQFTNILYEATSKVSTKNLVTKKKSKTITNKDDINYILSIDHKKASEKDTVMQLFADFGDGPKYNVYDLIKIPPKTFGGLSNSSDEYNKNDAQESSKKTNKSEFITSVGLWIFNRSFIEPISDIIGYINKPITKKVFGNINEKVSYALLEDKITIRQLKNFIMQNQILMSCCSALTPAHTEALLYMQEDIEKKKAELEKKYKKELDAGDLVVMKKMENELIDYAKDLLEGDDSLDMYDSGARSTYDNNFKNMYIMRSGAMQTNGDVKIITSSYISGLKEKDYVINADASIGGPYSKSKATSSGGYLEKQLTAATAHIKTPKEGTDCGTKDTITVNLNKGNIKDWYYSYILQNGKLIELLPENADKFINKTVNMRFSALCKNKDGTICEACAGTLFRRIGIDGVGLTSMNIGSALKNKRMKAFHDTNINLYKIDPEKAFNL